MNATLSVRTAVVSVRLCLLVSRPTSKAAFDKALLFGPITMGTGIPRTSAAGAPAPSPKLDRPVDEGGYQNDHAYDQQVRQAISDDADDTQNDRHNDQ
jgi:hypothetical protein